MGAVDQHGDVPAFGKGCGQKVGAGVVIKTGARGGGEAESGGGDGGAGLQRPRSRT